MTIDAANLGPGDLIVTLEGKFPFSHAIRLGAWLRRQPTPVDHVIGVHHHGAPPGAGPGTPPRWWGIEGRPGGVGWRDLTPVLARRSSWANTGQIRWEAEQAARRGEVRGKSAADIEQEKRFLAAAYFERLLKLPYDWEAIVAHARIAARANHVKKLGEWKDGEFPADVVCSSAMDGAYEYLGLDNPGGLSVTRLTSPAMVLAFFRGKPWFRSA